LNGGVKVLVGGLFAVLILVGILFATGFLSLEPQAVIPTVQGDIECFSFDECSQILRGMGYSDQQIGHLLTICDEQGCRRMP
jgi:hypothetical protein